PDIDGGTVVSQIRCSEELKNTRVVFLTAVITQKEISTQSGMLNSVPCIAKPVSTEDLIACIEKYTKKD
ncbi:MAG: hypothetical protein Q8R16_03465, partial [bacterium]|nr:hypothetical protein [bacterium]